MDVVVNEGLKIIKKIENTVYIYIYRWELFDSDKSGEKKLSIPSFGMEKIWEVHKHVHWHILNIVLLQVKE